MPDSGLGYQTVASAYNLLASLCVYEVGQHPSLYLRLGLMLQSNNIATRAGHFPAD